MTARVRGAMPVLGTPLTRRQVQIIAGLARGDSNIEIGRRLFLSGLTVKSHIQRIGAATGCSSRAAKVDHGYRTGILSGLPPEPRPSASLSEQDQQVLEGMARGLTNAEIGWELGVTGGVVAGHATRVFRRLGARDRAHAVGLGHQQGLLGAGVGAVAA